MVLELAGALGLLLRTWEPELSPVEPVDLRGSTDVFALAGSLEVLWVVLLRSPEAGRR